jgi:hypothetical protein
MPTMSMNKVIHRAVRRDLGRFVEALENFRDGDAERARQLGRAWDNFDAQLTDHHHGEHEIAWPHLERAGIQRTLLDEMDAEHHVMADALASARTAMAALRDEPTSARATEALEAVRRLQTVTVTHLDHEESEIEEFYLSHHDHPEIKAMGREFGKQKPAIAGRFFAWVTDGATAEERAAMEVPGPVFAVLNGVWGRGYRKDVAPVWRS